MTAPAPDGAGQIAAMSKALRQAGLGPKAVGHINAHATGTAIGDVGEARAIVEVFGLGAVATAPKASMGHLFGAAGAVEALLTILSVEHGVVPPTRNLTTGIDPEIELDVPTTRRDAVRGPAMSNSFGFGGQNVSLLFAPA